MMEHMATALLPQSISLRKCFTVGSKLSGHLPLVSFSRLAEVVHKAPGVVEIALRFSHDAENRRVVSGQMFAAVEVKCQRCLEPFSLKLEVNTCWALVFSDQEAKILPSCLEPVIIFDDCLNVSELIEEELLLNIPFTTVHPVDECIGKLSYEGKRGLENTAFGEVESPFTILKDFNCNDTNADN